MTQEHDLSGRWALILGASSGFGRATALELAGRGMNIFGVHLDMKSTLPLAKQVVADIETLGRQAIFFNTNAADARKRARVLGKIQAKLEADGGPQTVHILMHSLAFGSLLPFLADSPDEAISEPQMDMTLNVMAHSLVYWTQDMVRSGLLGRGSRIFSMTSSGSHRIFKNYGAVSAAKAALESHTRQLAYELGPKGVLINCINAGVTDTPALRKIPGHQAMVDLATNSNPGGRMTTEQDVAVTIAALADPRIQWISGSVIFVDGGEDIVGA